MCRRITLLLVVSTLVAVAASAIDLGGHLGYYDNDVKKAYVGADLMFPIGMVAISPNIDYTKVHKSGLWWGAVDVDLRFPQRQGLSYWFGAGPTYYYVTNYSEGSSGGYGRNGAVFAAASSDKIKEWGWDVNGGIGFSGTFRPYITARYNKIKEYKAGGVAVGLRFGH